MSNQHPTWSEIRGGFLADLKDVVPVDACCGTCRWWEANDPIGCRRYAPDIEGWPHTEPEDYCGEWESGYSPVPR
jgi:hypothetical protein